MENPIERKTSVATRRWSWVTGCKRPRRCGRAGNVTSTRPSSIAAVTAARRISSLRASATRTPVRPSGRSRRRRAPCVLQLREIAEATEHAREPALTSEELHAPRSSAVASDADESEKRLLRSGSWSIVSFAIASHSTRRRAQAVVGGNAEERFGIHWSRTGCEVCAMLVVQVLFFRKSSRRPPQQHTTTSGLGRRRTGVGE